MNELVQELAKQAGFNHPDAVGMSEMYAYFDHIKFAQLIVDECIGKIESYTIPVGNCAAGEMACEWTYDALKEIRGDIQEHFATKELQK